MGRPGAAGGGRPSGRGHLGQRRVVADGAAVVHGFRVQVLGFRFSVKESGEKLSGKGPKGQHGWDGWQINLAKLQNNLQ